MAAKKIFKYQLSIDYRQSIKIPKNGIIRKLGIQKDTACLWVEVDTTNDLEDRIFLIFSTGQIIRDENINYIDSFTLYKGELVFHVYEQLINSNNNYFSDVSEQLITNKIISIIKEEGKLSAIKYIKDLTNIGLMEAKQYVDRISLENNL